MQMPTCAFLCVQPSLCSALCPTWLNAWAGVPCLFLRPELADKAQAGQSWEDKQKLEQLDFRPYVLFWRSVQQWTKENCGGQRLYTRPGKVT